MIIPFRVEVNMSRLKTVLGVAIGISLLATSANALSCARIELGDAMETAKTSPKTYFVLVGNFHFPVMPENPKFDPQNQMQERPPRVARAYFDGYSLSPNRHTDVPLRGFPVDVEVSCLGPWCGGFPTSERRQIAFVEERYGQPPVLRISACPGQTYEWQNREQIRELRSCFYRKCKTRDPYEIYR